MKKLAVLVLLVLAGAEGTPSATLYDQSIAQVLGKQFSSPALSYLVINVQTGTRVAARWENLGPQASMIKNGCSFYPASYSRASRVTTAETGTGKPCLSRRISLGRMTSGRLLDP